MENDLIKIGEAVEKAAYDIFDTCCAESDFCIQSADGFVAIFGGTNRVIFDPRNPIAFYPDRTYCTEHFLAKWDEYYG